MYCIVCIYNELHNVWAKGILYLFIFLLCTPQFYICNQTMWQTWRFSAFIKVCVYTFWFHRVEMTALACMLSCSLPPSGHHNVWDKWLHLCLWSVQCVQLLQDIRELLLSSLDSKLLNAFGVIDVYQHEDHVVCHHEAGKKGKEVREIGQTLCLPKWTVWNII